MARRKQPANPPPAVPSWQATRKTEEEHGQAIQVQQIGTSEVVIQTRKYRLITPLFGGGVVAGVNDSEHLIRLTGIRGQLRFWWRATHGWQCGKDLVAMKKREDQIWGIAALTSSGSEENQPEKPGYKAVHMMVKVIDEGKPVKPFIMKDEKHAENVNDIPDYAAFPLRPNETIIEQYKKNTPINDVRKDVTFLLTLTFAREGWQEVQDALWAWETFGGVGARTRRGFGALKLLEIDGQAVSNNSFPPAQEAGAKTWLVERIGQYWPEERNQIASAVPYLPNDPDMMELIGPENDASKIWNALIEKFKQFRQRRFNFKTNRYSPFGKSLWPEVNALRKRLYPARQIRTLDKFPRAAFGLPIVFHLPHDKEAGKPNITLQGPNKEIERLASPLILKPIPCQNGKFLGLAIILDAPDLPINTLALQKEGWQPSKSISTEQTQIEARDLPQLPDVLHGKTNVLLAFLKYLKRR